VRRRHTAHRRDQQLDDVAGVEAASIEGGGQRLALQVLHDEERRPVVLADVVHVDHVGVVDAPGSLRLADEALHGALVRGELGQHPLERHALAGEGVSRRVHSAHAALADHVLDAVLAGNNVTGPRHGPICHVSIARPSPRASLRNHPTGVTFGRRATLDRSPEDVC
jgi:hypothetical protein